MLDVSVIYAFLETVTKAEERVHELRQGKQLLDETPPKDLDVWIALAMKKGGRSRCSVTAPVSLIEPFLLHELQEAEQTLRELYTRLHKLGVPLKGAEDV